MSSTKDKFRKAFTKFKSTKPPLDPGEIDKMTRTDEEKLVLLTNWANAEETLLRNLHNPRLWGDIIHQGTATAYQTSTSVKQLTNEDWNDLINKKLSNNKLKQETAAKKLMSRLNTLSCIAGILENGKKYKEEFQKARDSKFLIRLCKNR